MEHIIYEKWFPEDTANDSSDVQSFEFSSLWDKMSPEDISRWIHKGVTYIFLPKRQQLSKSFVQKAIRLSNLYQVDIRIRSRFECIVVTYYLESGVGLGIFKNLLRLADDVSILPAKDKHKFTLSLIFFTHAVYFRRIRLYP